MAEIILFFKSLSSASFSFLDWLKPVCLACSSAVIFIPLEAEERCVSSRPLTGPIDSAVSVISEYPSGSIFFERF